MQMMRAKEYIFMAVIFVIGILTVFSYGSYLDQTSEQRIMIANMKEYMIQLQGEPSAMTEELTAQGVIEISLDEDRDHGMAVYYPVFWVWQLNQSNPWLGSIIWHIYTFILVFWGMCSLYLLMKEMFQNSNIACFTVLLFFLTPRMFAESHYNNKDVVILSMLFTLFYWAVRLMKGVSAKTIFMFALMGALLSNMKIIGMWFFGLLGIYVVIYFVVKKQYTEKLLGQTLVCVGLWAVLYVLMTPALWADPAAFFQYLFGNAIDYDLWHDYVLFNGTMVHKDYTGIPRKYLPVLIVITTPVGILALTVIGFLVAGWELIKSKGRKLLEKEGLLFVFAGAVGVPLVYAVLAATPLYNGWRHFYFVYAAMIIGTGYGVFWIIRICRKKSAVWQKGIYAVEVLYLGVLIAGIIDNYPYEYSYYNFLAGENVVERYELDYWDLSVKQAFEKILEDAQDGIQIKVSALNLPTMWGLEGNRKVLPVSQRDRLSIEQDWENAEYLIVNTTYAVMYSKEQYQQIKENSELVEAFTSYGNIICEVYRRNL